MKRKFLYLLLTLCLLGQCLPAFAAQAPVLEHIAFSGATIVGQFKSDVYQYQLVLDNAAVSPKLKSYKVQGEGNLFVTYDTDSTNHQTAVVVTLSYDTGSAKYTFTYKNAAAYVKNSENHLDSITCTLGELVPEMNADDTTYKLYIPSDLTSLMITPVTKDINAYCAPVEMTLAPEQEIDLTLPVTASDGQVRTYTIKVRRVDKTVEQVRAEMAQEDYTSFVEGTRFYQQPAFRMAVTASDGQVRTYTIKVRRVDKTVEQVRAEMAQEDYTSFVEGTRFYQQPAFRMAVTAGVCGLAVLIVLLAFHARKTARVTDEDEPSFYRSEQ